MLAGELPWDKPVFDCEDFISWVKYNNYQKTPWCKIENTALSLLRNILMFEPSQRFTMRQIKSSSWFVKTYKQPAYESFNQNNAAFLSQPTYVFMHDPSLAQNAAAKINLLADIGLPTELEYTDSQQNCECTSSSSMMPLRPIANNAQQHHHNNLPSFSQPINAHNMFLNSQAYATQQTLSSQAAASQSPLFKLVKRMTRMFVHLNVEACAEELKKLFTKFKYDFRVSVINDRQRQITVTTSDKRQSLLTFKVNVIEMNAQNEVLVDFRLSKGDGLEFKKIFVRIKTSLQPIVCKRYVFTNNSHACCDKKINCV
jgi:serine/threonine-protein kinase Chk1